MSIFDRQVEELEKFFKTQFQTGRLRKLTHNAELGWSKKEELILSQDCALEIGNPSIGSLLLILWTEKPFGEDSIWLLGSDISELKKGAPFAQIILVSGEFPDHYDCYCQLRDAVYQTYLAGLMIRLIPSRQKIWLRLNQWALDKGFSLAHLGSALIRSLKSLEFVHWVKIVFITDENFRPLLDIGEEIKKITNALIKMNEELSLDCNTCEYRDICESISELKRIREKLLNQKRN